jgi:transposase
MRLGKTNRWFVGIDWASEDHQVCVLGAGGEVIGERVVTHSGDGIAELCDWLQEVGEGDLDNVHVAIEVPHGAVVEMLLERGAVVYAINPKQLDRFRDRFTVAGAKDDRRDALVLADSLRTDPQSYRLLQVGAPAVIELREWSRMAEELRQERNRLGNRIWELLRRYYPQMLELSNDVAAEWFLDVWDKAPTPAQAARTRESTIARILKQHRIRRVTAAEALRVLRQTPLAVSPGTTAAATAHIRSVSARVRLVNKQLKQAHQRLDELTKEVGEQDQDGDEKSEHSDAEILESLPGIGRIVLAALLAEASQPLGERDYHFLRTLTGVAPVTRRSGKRTRVVMRQACHPRLRNAVYHWARVAVQRDPVSRARYAALRAKGHAHGRALRTIGDRLLKVACAMLRDRTLFDPSRRMVGQMAA